MWRDQQPLREYWLKNKDEPAFKFSDRMSTYLEGDVDVLYELVEAMGSQKAEAYGVDIRKKCTLGSIADWVWSHTLLKSIPKLTSEEDHLLWQNVSCSL